MELEGQQRVLSLPQSQSLTNNDPEANPPSAGGRPESAASTAMPRSEFPSFQALSHRLRTGLPSLESPTGLAAPASVPPSEHASFRSPPRDISSGSRALAPTPHQSLDPQQGTPQGPDTLEVEGAWVNPLPDSAISSGFSSEGLHQPLVVRVMGPLTGRWGALIYGLLLVLGGIYTAAYEQPRRIQCLFQAWSCVLMVCSVLCTALAVWNAWSYGEWVNSRPIFAVILAAHATSRAVRTAALWALQRQDWRQLTAREGPQGRAASAHFVLGLFTWLQAALWLVPLFALLGVASIALQGFIYWPGYEPPQPLLLWFVRTPDVASTVEALGTVPFVCSLVVIFGAVDGANVHVSEASRKALATLSVVDARSYSRLGPCWLCLAEDLRRHCLQFTAPVCTALLALGLSATSSGLDMWYHFHEISDTEYKVRYSTSELLYCLLWSCLLLVLMRALVSVSEAAHAKFVRPLERWLGCLHAPAAQEDQGVERVQAALLLMSSRPLGWFITDSTSVSPAVYKVLATFILTNGSARVVAFLAGLKT